MIPEFGAILSLIFRFPETMIPQNGKILRLLRLFMPKGLKSTSSPIQISQRIRGTTAAGVTEVEDRVDLQLNPLDNEVFVVTGLKIDFTNPSLQPVTTPGRFVANVACSVSKISVTGTPGIDNPSVIGASKVTNYIQNDATSGDIYTTTEQNAMDAPPSSMDYLDIIATNDFYLNLLLSDHYAAGQTAGADVRVYGYRAVADAATYAALVQSEMLSR